MDDKTVTELTADIVGAYVANNRVASAEVASIIQTVAQALRVTGGAASDPTPEAPSRVTPAQIRRSITPEALISFIDGKPYRLLKRHLTQHDHTPESYRRVYGLPADYPMTAPAYSAQRSEFAKARGLGVRLRADPSSAAAPVG